MTTKGHRIRANAVIRAALTWAAVENRRDEIQNIETAEAQREWDILSDEAFNELLPALQEACAAYRRMCDDGAPTPESDEED